MVNAVSLVVFVCASLFVVALMMSAVGARRREIGVLRAIGASSAMIAGAILWEILILCAAGALFGGLLAAPCLMFLLDANIFDPVHVLSYMPIAFPLAIASGIVPALAALRVPPIEALRHE
jgi:putative ABC transport system permease protein